MKHLLLIFCCTAFAQQDITNMKWITTGHLGVDVSSEFGLLLPHTYDPVGYILELNPDSSFKNSYSSWCANDCFKSNTGTWQMADANHIRFTVTGQKNHSQWCAPDTLPIDCGLFAIIRENDTIKSLIKSDGTVKGDSLMKRYSIIAHRIDRELFIEEYKGEPLAWQDVAGASAPEQLVAYFAAHNPGFTSKVKIVFTSTYFFAEPIILFEDKGKLYALVYDQVTNEAALYGEVTDSR